MKTKYYYETYTSDGSLKAHNDAEAISVLNEKFNQNLEELLIVYVEEDVNQFRTVWSSLKKES